MFIGHNKDLIEHLNNINVCHTYYVKTNGMTIYDMENIKNEFTFEPI